MNRESEEKLSLLSLRPPRRRYLWALSLVLALIVGVKYDQWILLRGAPPGAQEQFALVAQAWNLIQFYYVDRDAPRPTVLAHGAVQGMTEALGDTGHTTFLNPQMSRHADKSMGTNFSGIGVQIQINTNRQAVILAALDASPAMRAGLRAGDIILEVDGQPVTGMPMIELEERITGPVGQPVKLGVLVSHNARRQDFTILRASIKIANVSWRPLPDGGPAYLRVAMFNEGAAQDFHSALLEIQRKGCKAVILDLRDNPGGVLDEAVGVASEFLSGGDVLLEKNANGKISHHPVKPGGIATNLPLVVLINGFSASASEIVAGALQDAHRATLVGRTTFGTGTVLQKFPLLDGSALLLAVDEWLTPSGRSFWHKGVKPDEDVVLAADTPPLIPAVESDLTSATLQSSGDTQLLRAIALLSAPPK
ncbi:MAG: S41 family peptidase [Verrucomicrobiota bacterium]|jgi:carboxyl-terminal processing protease